VRLNPEGDAAPAPSLSTTTVSNGGLPSERTVVCGRATFPAGRLVVLAGVGSKLPGVSFVLEPREIGGVLSEGMLCSESELALADQSAGLITFEPEAIAPVRDSSMRSREAGDVIFELDVTPNRPDALGTCRSGARFGRFF
jgi:phenylalanyl-tRNA synthetase beta chain